MATYSSFKQQCPSCEAIFPIRDASLIGKKIECPKCKYRFVVEEPEETDDEAPDSAAKKTKAGGAAVTNKKPANGKAAKPVAPATKTKTTTRFGRKRKHAAAALEC